MKQSSNILLESEYYKTWLQHSSLAKSSLRSQTSQLKKLGEFIMLQNPVRKLDFDKFYYIESNDSYEPFDEEFMDEYIDYLKGLGTSKATLYTNISAIKNFFLFLKTVGLIDKHPLRYYSNPYYDLKKWDRAFSLEEALQLLNAAYKLDPFFKSYFVLILLLLTCGLRAQEVCMLRKSQVKFDRKTVEVTKGHKTHASVVWMTELLMEEFYQYFNHPRWQSWANGRDKEVFFYEGKTLNHYRLKKMIQQVYEEAEIKRHVRLHDLRYTMAYLLYIRGINTISIKKQLRHEKLDTTMHYLSPNEDLKKALEISSLKNDN
ncbi:tyrosine-type recombinase/integrase [Alteribacillus sp. JSM 102045]|uniref:tyrosine-type recombinase/integrase n=1 Tax=Alteribacillus sp. JSM 102045 TaxID=1562101 RepID=UPI0035BF03F1